MDKNLVHSFYIFQGLLLIIAGFRCHAIQDQNQNQNHSIDKVQNLGNERRYQYANTLAKIHGQCNISPTRYPEKCFIEIKRDLYGHTMLVAIRMGTNMAAQN